MSEDAEACQRCKGYGSLVPGRDDATPCGQCKGTGRTRRDAPIPPAEPIERDAELRRAMVIVQHCLDSIVCPCCGSCVRDGRMKEFRTHNMGCPLVSQGFAAAVGGTKP